MTRPRCRPVTAGSEPARPARPRVGGRALAGLLLALLAVGGAARPAAGQVFLASRSHPDFMVGPLLITATVQPDLGPVVVRVTWSLTLAPHVRPDDVRQDLYLLWPAEAVSGPPESADPALAGYVEERGFVVIGAGRLPLAVRDRAKLGTGAASDPLPDSAPFVTIYKRGTVPGQAPVGTFVRVPWTPQLVDPHALLSLTLTLKDLITPKPATWLEELFWGRRHVLSLGAGTAGSVALYSMYFDQRDRVLRLARDFSLLGAEFADADHLRIEEIAPAGASRRPSRVRAGAETVTLALGATEGPQVLTVRFSYFSGRIAWRPILVSILLLALGNLMGAFMFTREISRFFRRRVHVGRAAPRPDGPVVDGVGRLVPGETTEAEVLRWCGPPAEERARRQAGGRRVLVYRATRRVPHWRLRLGWLGAVRRWDEEDHEVEIEITDGRVRDVETRIRRPSSS